MGKFSLLNRIFLIFFPILFFSQNTDVIEVQGQNWIPVMQHASFFIDYGNKKNVEEIASELSKFKKNNDRTLILKREPNNIWVHIKIKNSGNEQRFFLGQYSQSDTLEVYEKRENRYYLKNASYYNLTSKKRNKYDVRYHVTPFILKHNEEADVLMKIANRRHYVNIYVDFTTSEDNLIWETKFHGEINFFSGIFFIIILVSLGMGFFSKEKIFYIYALYLSLIATLILHEELFISSFENDFLYNFFYRLNSSHFLLIAMGLNIYLFLDITETKKFRTKFYYLSLYFARGLIVLGLLISTIYFIFYKNLSFANNLYSLVWDVIIILLIISIFIIFGVIILYFSRIKKLLLGILVAVMFLLFNPVTYFFNYSQIFTIYEITHPNYFYYILILEIFVFGGIIALKYRNLLKNSLKTMSEKIHLERENFKILENQEEKIKKSIVESQENLLKNLSQDLHDDIGQKLTIINFSVENLKFSIDKKEQIDEIRTNILDISNSIRNLSHWLKEFKLESLNINEIIESEVARLKRSNLIKINYTLYHNSIKNYHTNTTENIILYRIFQEVINNILKHSKATEMFILIDFRKNIEIEISDNGLGFNKKNTGNGITNIMQRVKVINYICEIHSEVNSGTKIKIYKP